jgi:hypothetical protein
MRLAERRADLFYKNIGLGKARLAGGTATTTLIVLAACDHALWPEKRMLATATPAAKWRNSQ